MTDLEISTCISQLRYNIVQNDEFEIVKGLVVPIGSYVQVGLTVPWQLQPTADASTSLLKTLLGIRRKKAAVDAEDEAPQEAKRRDDEDDEESEASDEDEESEEENENNSEDSD